MSGTDVPRESVWLMWQAATTERWSSQVPVSLSPETFVDFHRAAEARHLETTIQNETAINTTVSLLLSSERLVLPVASLVLVDVR